MRHGRLAAAGVMPMGTRPQPWVDILVATAESVPSGFGPVPSATAEETELILRWLESPGNRIERGAWQAPLASAARHLKRYSSDPASPVAHEWAGSFGRRRSPNAGGTPCT